MLPEERIQEGLAGLGDRGLMTDHYYTAAYAVYAEAMLDRFAARWPSNAGDATGNGGTADFPGPADRDLAVYYPSLARYPSLSSDPAWEPSMRAFLAEHYA